ncbi:unnamed protein product [Citrullus colocynthis]|uniref:Zinc finger PHD-type domain-containing protein n=1 Tax=Citrullus colocynthis TaxID=252529 RepID=A0ABP0YG39_9ROSI
MVVNARPLKRMKRRVTADLYDFLSFPSSSMSAASPDDSDHDHLFTGPFRTNVRTFLSKHALLPPPSSLFPHLLTWQILFRIGDLVDGPDSQPAIVYLDIVEEDVPRSRSVYCDQCRVVGWSAHPVCAKRYHFIIKANGSSIGGYHKPCMCCGDVLHLSESKCKSCNHVTSTDDVEDWVYQQLENNTHLLHAVVHSNGYGHLLRVNGREGGSRHLSGCHIMDFWDRFCKMLGVRKVSVMDVSKKYGVEYRLLHAITKGHPWYGEWGYEFGAGSFAVTPDAYKMAVETLSSLPLSIFTSQGRKPRSHLQDIILYYQSLSERKLVNVRDLFRFLMSLIHNVRKSSTINDVTDEKQQSKVLCSWTRSDVTRVEEAMLKVLHAVSGSNWVTWRTLRGAVCKAGPPELLDYCLKNLGGKVSSDGMVVNAQRNPQSGAFEYRLEPSSVSLNAASDSTESSISSYPSEENLLLDLRFLYDAMLHPHSMVNYGPQATREAAVSSALKLIDCKQFVKDYKPEKLSTKLNPFSICLLCEVEVVEDSKDNSSRPPPELVILPSNATMSDLKLEASKAFQDVYLMFRRFQAEEIVDHGGVDDSTQVKLLFGQTESVCVRGRCQGKIALNRFRMERGVERWTVDCSCGAKDDDGERMLACDLCGVWRHTRCSGIQDSDDVPGKFVCYKCRSSIVAMNTNGETEADTLFRLGYVN